MPCSISEVQPAELWKKSLERFEIRFYFEIHAFPIHKTISYTETDLKRWEVTNGSLMISFFYRTVSGDFWIEVFYSLHQTALAVHLAIEFGFILSHPICREKSLLMEETPAYLKQKNAAGGSTNIPLTAEWIIRCIYVKPYPARVQKIFPFFTVF